MKPMFIFRHPRGTKQVAAFLSKFFFQKNVSTSVAQRMIKTTILQAIATPAYLAGLAQSRSL